MSRVLLYHPIYFNTDCLTLSHGSLLDKSCRLHYSRLCNLLLRRGKISPELEGLTRAALGSDSEREAFFLGYEMTDQLFSFYIEQRKYLEAFNLAVKNCDLDKAWKVIEMHGDDCQLPQRQKIEVFNYVQMKYLLASLAGSSMELFPFSTTWGPWLPDNLSVQDFWRDLGKTIGALLGGKISYDSIRFADTWMKQLFDIIVSELCELTPWFSLISVVGHFQSPCLHQFGTNNEAVTNRINQWSFGNDKRCPHC